MQRILSFTFAATLLACSSSSSPPAETTDDDTGTPVDDSSTATDSLDDTGSSAETSAGDSTITDSTTSTDSGGSDGASDAPADTGSTTCADAGAIETQDCGKCGNKARLCGDDGMWLPFGACTGEKGVCVPGDTRTTACGKCGKRTETCSATCGWTPGACADEGVCNLGDTETQYGACTAAKEVKIRTCDATCNWSAFGACTAPKGWNDMALAPISGRYYHTAVWTGSEMIVWGGYSSSSSYAADGAAYDLSKDTWRTLEAVPSGFVGREYHTAVWTGSKMIVWGGYNAATYKNDGAIYDPALKTWTVIAPPSTFTLAGRYWQSAVWSSTTNEMIIWGGYGTGCSGSYCNDGAAFNPTTGMWRQIKASPLSGRYQAKALFVGGKMVVYGGYGTTCSYYCGDAAYYDPSADTWTTLTPPSTDLDARYQHMAVATGTGEGLATFWGGYGNYISPGYDRNTGATYDPVAGTWKSITPPTDSVITYSRRYNAFAWWGAGKLWIWGGTSYSGGTMATGMSYDPTSDTWTAMPTTNAPTARYSGTVVWTGSEAILWGGYSYKQDGKIYRP
jgi:N-acetylneuraminic acid mutarotase